MTVEMLGNAASRVSYTEEAIKDAFLNFLKCKDYMDITVNLTMNGPQEYIKCRGLEPNRLYTIEGDGEKYTASGMALMHAGIPVPREVPDFTAFIYHLKAIG